jgi:hypothetical protein
MNKFIIFFIFIFNINFCFAIVNNDSTKYKERIILDTILDATNYHDSLLCYIMVQLECKDIQYSKACILINDTSIEYRRFPNFHYIGICPKSKVNHIVFKDLIDEFNRLSKIQCISDNYYLLETGIKIILFQKNDSLPIRIIRFFCDEQIDKILPILEKIDSGPRYLDVFIEHYKKRKQKE